MKQHRWEGYIKRVLYSYPSLKKAQEELRETITTAAYGVFGGRSPDPSDPVAAAALRELPPSDRRELEAVEKAICATRALGNGEQRLKVIELIYWRRSHTLEGAARVVHYSYRQTRRLQFDFLAEVAKNLGIA